MTTDPAGHVALKSCPFCGETPTDPHDSAAIYCDNRDCRVNPHTSKMTKRSAIAAWNTRAADAEIERLRDAAENVLIAWGMGWDMNGVMDVMQAALAPAESK